ncbi:uncharacterized protein LOC130623598 isoform X1 [Hydractinia symbiolongicarpus]|uniref:uncharacterized protein LOC130623598 isoform X1 n=1 Tax=Hydractinia symbiolongicarpus TaxID=13093 RepID=UPI00254F0CE2|nr:uncharacterized protein LOC130623598 isoform X1 [Hydractinia symbiolongicarpus]
MLVDGKMKLVKKSSIYMSVIFLLYVVECLKVSRKYRDVIQNVNKSECDQLSNTVWGRSNGLCKCSSRDRTFHIVNGTAGCFRRSKISPGCKKDVLKSQKIYRDMEDCQHYSLLAWNSIAQSWVNIHIKEHFDGEGLNIWLNGKLNNIKGRLVKLLCGKRKNPSTHVISADCYVYKKFGTYTYYTTITAKTSTPISTTTSKQITTKSAMTLKENSNGNSNSIIIGSACAMVVIVVLILIVLIVRWKKANRTPSNSTVKSPSCVDNNNQGSLKTNNYASDNYATADLQMVSHLQYKKGEKAKEEEIYKEIDKNGVFDEDYAQLSYCNSVQTSLQNDGLNEPLYFETAIEADTENKLVSEPVYVETVPED